MFDMAINYKLDPEIYDLKLCSRPHLVNEPTSVELLQKEGGGIAHHPLF